MVKTRRDKSKFTLGALLDVVELFHTFLIILFISLIGINIVGSKNNKSQEESLRTSINQSISNHYAIYGKYPASFNELKDRYGIQVDESQYIVDYEVFAENVRPTVKILNKQRNTKW